MNKKILGVNLSHNSSFAFFKNNTLIEYYEEDRFNKIKNFRLRPKIGLEYEFECLKKFKNIEFDMVIFNSFDWGDSIYEKILIDNILPQIKFKKYIYVEHEHHLFHVLCGFYFSKFEEAIGIVVDGGGERIINPLFRTIQSIWKVNNKNINVFYRHATMKRNDYFSNFVDTEENFKDDFGCDTKLSNKLAGGQRYLYYRTKSGFKRGEEGQLMGIAAYKNKKTDIEPELIEIANKAQDETLEEVIKLIEKAMTYSDCRNIILSGGYHLNCSNNFKLVKHFPHLKIFVDPIPYDGGTAVGACLYDNYKR